MSKVKSRIGKTAETEETAETSEAEETEETEIIKPTFNSVEECAELISNILIEAKNQGYDQKEILTVAAGKLKAKKK